MKKGYGGSMSGRKDIVGGHGNAVRARRVAQAGPKHDKMQHPTHKAQNANYGLPGDVFSHDGAPYGAGANTNAMPQIEGAPQGGGIEGGDYSHEMSQNECMED